jgi:tRNA (guanosine-2'-O-)-methyltransferase
MIRAFIFESHDEQREEKIQRMLANRQHDLTVIFENIDDPHNISACLRSCDSVGISEVYILSSRIKAIKTWKEIISECN